MAMDVRRSCRVELCQFFGGVQRLGPETVSGLPGGNACIFFANAPSPAIPIRWYFCEPGAKHFPVPTLWASSLYLDLHEKAEVEYGVLPFAKASWSNGKAPPGASGKHFCGKLSDFTEVAAGPSPRGPLARTPGGLPVCCNVGFIACIVWTTRLPVPGFIVWTATPAKIPQGAIVFTAFSNGVCKKTLFQPYITLQLPTGLLYFSDVTLNFTPGPFLPYPTWTATASVEIFSETYQIRASLNYFPASPLGLQCYMYYPSGGFFSSFGGLVIEPPACDPVGGGYFGEVFYTSGPTGVFGTALITKVY